MDYMQAPPADDRDDNDEDATAARPARPADLKALKAIWRDRDVLYAKRDKALTDDQIETVRVFRQDESNDIPVAQRARAWGLATSWYPPEHGQGTL